MDKHFHLNAEFRRRLLKVEYDLDQIIRLDDSQGFLKLGNLVPHLFQLFSYMWMKKEEDLIHG